MNIVGEGFPEEIIKQVDVRQNQLGLNSRSNENLVWVNTKSGWCRMVSSVDVIQTGIRDLPYTGTDLARNFVLFNGVSIGKNGLRGGIWPGGGSDPNNYAYGIGGSDMGLKPMPGINQATIKTETRGSLKTATINITAHNQKQFDIIDLLYMRLGYSILLEWGHSSYYDNNQTYIGDNSYSLTDEFLNGTLKYENHLSTINDYRLKSNGNYDAIIGKVVNFNWKFNKDGSYDITLTLRSMGDVVESLKMNLFTPTTTGSFSTQPTPPSGSSPIEAYANAHLIGRWFYNNKKNFSQGINYLTTSDPDESGYTTVPSGGSVSFIQQNSTQGIQYYVRFGRFLSFVQNNIIPYVNNQDTPLLGIDYKVEDNIIPLHPRQIPCDPSVCIFKCDLNNRTERYVVGGTLNTTADLIPQADEFVNPILTNLSTGLGYSYSTGQITGASLNQDYAWIMNAYFNCNWVLNKLNELKDKEGRVSIFDLIKSFCDGFNSSTGNYNRLEPIVREESNQIVILDQTQLQNREDFLVKIGKTTKTAFFNTYGFQTNSSGSIVQGSFIKDFSFNTTITPEFATMITIGATSNGYVVGQDATALSSMNAGLVDRFKKEIKTPGDPNVQVSASQTLDPLSRDFKNQAITIYRGLPNSISIYNLDVNSMSSMTTLLNQLIETDTRDSLEQNVTSSTTNTGFLPFDLQLTMDGLSGMKVYQKFEADTRFFPSNYPNKLDFLIKGISNTISNNVWTTTLETLAIPKNPYGLSTTFGSNSGTTTTPSPTTSTPPTTAGNAINVAMQEVDKTPWGTKFSAVGGQNYRNYRTFSNRMYKGPIVRRQNTGFRELYQGSVAATVAEEEAFFKDILIGVGIPSPNSNQILFMKIWNQVEGAPSAWNPLNTTLRTSNSKPYNSAPVQNYPDRATGLRATIDTLKNSGNGQRYAQIIQAIKNIPA